MLKRSPAAKRPKPRPHHLGDKPPSSDVPLDVELVDAPPITRPGPALGRIRVAVTVHRFRVRSVVHEQPAGPDRGSGIGPAGRVWVARPENDPTRVELAQVAAASCASWPSAGGLVAAEDLFGVGEELLVRQLGRLVDRNGHGRPGRAALIRMSSAASVRYSIGQATCVCLRRISSRTSRKHSTPRSAGTEYSISLKRFSRTVGKDPPTVVDPLALGARQAGAHDSWLAVSTVAGRSVGLSVLVNAQSSAGYQKNSKCRLARLRSSRLSGTRRAARGGTSCNR